MSPHRAFRRRWCGRGGAFVFALALCAGPACTTANNTNPTATARRGTLVVGVEISGSILAREINPLGPPPISEMWEFHIRELAPEGAAVAAGDLVIRFDEAPLDEQLLNITNEVRRKEEELSRRRSRAEQRRRDDALRLAELEANHRKAALQASGPADLSAATEQRIAAIDLRLADDELKHDTARRSAAERGERIDIQALVDGLERAKRRLAGVEAARASLRVVAPGPGIVLYTTRNNGEKKKVGDRVWRAERPVQVVATDQLYAEVEIDEAESLGLAVGQGVRFRAEAHGDSEIEGTIERLGRSVVRGLEGVQVVRADITFDPTTTQGLRPGMRVRGQVEIARHEDVVVIPLEALGTGAGTNMVRGADGASIAVTLGARSRAEVEIRSGLQPGDVVQVAPTP